MGRDPFRSAGERAPARRPWTRCATTPERALYLDSSAAVKLVVEEPESAELVEAIRDSDLITSELTLAQLPRAIERLRSGRHRAEQEGLVRELGRTLAAFAFVPLDRRLLDAAGALPGACLRALDAIHVVSAVVVGEAIEAMLTYDERQQSTARRAGMQVLAPGVAMNPDD